MRTAFLATCIASLGMLAYGAIRPMELEKKAVIADLIVVGRVERIVRLSPDEDPINCADDMCYVGPGSLAVVSVREAWKFPDSTLFESCKDQSNVRPRFIYVPCDYPYSEAPASLTEKREYVLFLKKLGGNIYSPVDAASTHVVARANVSEFGMNIDPERFPTTKATDVQKYRTNVTRLINENKKDEPSHEP